MRDSQLRRIAMTEKEKLIEDHDYDGIRELNNPLPGWWLMTFYICIIFAVIYFAYYQLFGGPTLDQELSSQMSSIIKEQKKTEAAQGVKSQADYAVLLSNPEAIAKGKAEFMAKCMPCHGDKGQGIIGPNLTDNYWIHGDGTIPAILTVMNTGVPEKGMPSWKGVIPTDLQDDVAAYVYSIHGTNPPGAKAPQGEMIERK
jgi:cytochrome c oxidase cbb3-type subunit III